MKEMDVAIPFALNEYHICGVYKVEFDTGYYYIGSSVNLASRASAWKSLFLSNGDSHKEQEYVVKHIRMANKATLTLIELCSPEKIRIREAFYLEKFKDDEKMISNFQCQWKPVLQYSKDGFFIKRFPSIGTAAASLGVRKTSIERVASGYRNSINGYVFIYESDYDKRRADINRERYKKLKTKMERKKGRDVLILNEDGSVFKRFKKMVEAARFLGVSSPIVKNVLCGIQNKTKGYKVVYDNAGKC